MQPDETPHITALPILTGYFHAGSGYRAYRSAGVQDWLLVHTVAGAGRFGFKGGEHVTRPGDWVLLTPREMHDYGVEKRLNRWDLLWAHFQPRPHWRELLRWPRWIAGPMRLHVDPANRDLERQFHGVHAHASSGHRLGAVKAMHGLEGLLIALEETNPEARATRLDPRVTKATDFILGAPEGRVTVAEIARHVGLSPSRLSHLFVAETGQTLQTFVESVRMQRSAELLRRTTFSIQQIAAAAGFESPFYFSSRFRKWASCSPTEFRRRASAGKSQSPW